MILKANCPRCGFIVENIEKEKYVVCPNCAIRLWMVEGPKREDEVPITHGWFPSIGHLRNLSGIYYRCEINGKWENRVFEDWPEPQQDYILRNRTEEWLKELAKHLGRIIREIGNQSRLERDNPNLER